MRKINFYFFILLTTSSITSYAATDLLQVFQKAFRNDPQFQIKESTWRSHYQQIAIERSGLLPDIAIQSQYSTQNSTASFDLANQSSSVSLSLNQPIVNVKNWLQYQDAKMDAKAFQMEYGAGLQDLMVRTVESYFDVLVAQNQLHLNENIRDDYAKLLTWTKTRLEAGIIKMVDVDMVKAAYISSLGTVLDARQTLAIKRAHLQTMTGMQEHDLASLKTVIPVTQPSPSNLQAWIANIRAENLTVLADQYKLQASKKNIKTQQAQHYPTLNAGVNRNYYSNNTAIQGSVANDTNVMLTLSVPIYAGGRVSAQTRQAVYNYQTLSQQAELNYRLQLEQLQNSYQGVVNSVDKIQADRHIIVANQRALSSAKIAYQAGLSSTNINVVISAQQALYEQEKITFQDKRDYIVHLIKLKQASGLLSLKDLIYLNSWLKH